MSAYGMGEADGGEYTLTNKSVCEAVNVSISMSIQSPQVDSSVERTWLISLILVGDSTYCLVRSRIQAQTATPLHRYIQLY